MPGVDSFPVASIVTGCVIAGSALDSAIVDTDPVGRPLKSMVSAVLALTCAIAARSDPVPESFVLITEAVVASAAGARTSMVKTAVAITHPWVARPGQTM